MEVENGPTTVVAPNETEARTLRADDGSDSDNASSCTDATVRRDEAPRKKRKASPTELRETDDEVLGALVDDLTAACDKLTVSLRDTAFEQREVINVDNLGDLREAVRAVREYSETVKNRSPRAGSPNTAKPMTWDAATDTELTPHWWSASSTNVEDTPLACLGRPLAPDGMAYKLTRTISRKARAVEICVTEEESSGTSGRSDGEMEVDQ